MESATAVPHDPGGRVRLPLPPGMVGGAEFCGADGGPGDTHRPLLWRGWGEPGAAYALFVGMNPSVADASVDDPTVRREIGYCRRWGLVSFKKVNILDYRATYPEDLLLPGAVPRSPANLPTILAAAGRAERVVLAFGRLPRRLRPFAEEAVDALRSAGVPLWCLGTTLDRSPRHPLYLRNDAQLVLWEGWTLP